MIPAGRAPAPASRPVTLVAINGSERVDGNTAEVLAHAGRLAAGRGAVLDVIDLAAHRITPCGACGDCNLRRDPCLVGDDMPAIVRRMVAADGVLYAAPVHGFGMASMMQVFIERAGVGYLRFARPLTNKVAGVVVTGRRYSHGEVHAQLLHNVLLNRMLVAGSGFPAVVHGGARGDAVEDREGVDSVRRLIHRMVDLVELLHDYRRATGRGLPVPVDNERVLR